MFSTFSHCLPQLYDTVAAEKPELRKVILDSVAGEIELRSKRELIEKFIDSAMPNVDSAAGDPGLI